MFLSSSRLESRPGVEKVNRKWQYNGKSVHIQKRGMAMGAPGWEIYQGLRN